MQEEKIYTITSDPQQLRIRDDKNGYEGRIVELNKDTKGFKRIYECNIGCHDMGKRLEKDEQDALPQTRQSRVIEEEESRERTSRNQRSSKTIGMVA